MDKMILLRERESFPKITVRQQSIKEDSSSSKIIIKCHTLANKLQLHSIYITNEMRIWMSELQRLDICLFRGREEKE